MRFAGIFLIFIAVQLNAQSHGSPHQYVNEPPPFVLRHQVEWRKIYLLRSDDTSTARMDYSVEHFDKNGFPISTEHMYYGEVEGEDVRIRHRFSYDDLSRVKTDSADGTHRLRVTTYEYTGMSQIIIHHPMWLEEVASIIINYSKAHTKISEYWIDYNKDTVMLWTQTDHTETAIRRIRIPNGSMRITSKEVITRYPGISITADTLYGRNGKIVTHLKKELKDNAHGTITVLEYERDNQLRDSIVRTYNDKNLLVSEVHATYPYAGMGETDTAVSLSEYKYDNEGKLILITKKIVGVSHVIATTTYKYNDLGLIVEEKYTTNDGLREEVVWRKVWEYGFYY